MLQRRGEKQWSLNKRVPVAVDLDAPELDYGLGVFPYPSHPARVTPPSMTCLSVPAAISNPLSIITLRLKNGTSMSHSLHRTASTYMPSRYDKPLPLVMTASHRCSLNRLLPYRDHTSPFQFKRPRDERLQSYCAAVARWDDGLIDSPRARGDRSGSKLSEPDPQSPRTGVTVDGYHFRHYLDWFDFR